MNSTFEFFISNLVTALPQVAIATVGLVLTHSKLKQFHPKAYRYGTFGFALLLASGLWGVLSRTYIQVAFAAQSQHPVALGNKTTMANLAGFVVFTASLVFILFAVFADRDSGKNSRGAA